MAFIPRDLAVEYVKKKRKWIWFTFALLILLAAETWYLNCYIAQTPWCPMVLVWLALAVIISWIPRYYR